MVSEIECSLFKMGRMGVLEEVKSMFCLLKKKKYVFEKKYEWIATDRVFRARTVCAYFVCEKYRWIAGCLN